jgi:hypothetical protein
LYKCYEMVSMLPHQMPASVELACSEGALESGGVGDQ